MRASRCGSAGRSVRRIRGIPPVAFGSIGVGAERLLVVEPGLATLCDRSHVICVEPMGGRVAAGLAASASGGDQSCVSHPLRERAGFDGHIGGLRVGRQGDAAQLGDAKERRGELWVQGSAVDELAPEVGIVEVRRDLSALIALGGDELFGERLADDDTHQRSADCSVATLGALSDEFRKGRRTSLASGAGNACLGVFVTELACADFKRVVHGGAETGRYADVTTGFGKPWDGPAMTVREAEAVYEATTLAPRPFEWPARFNDGYRWNYTTRAWGLVKTPNPNLSTARTWIDDNIEARLLSTPNSVQRVDDPSLVIRSIGKPVNGLTGPEVGDAAQGLFRTDVAAVGLNEGEDFVIQTLVTVRLRDGSVVRTFADGLVVVSRTDQEVALAIVEVKGSRLATPGFSELRDPQALVLWAHLNDQIASISFGPRGQQLIGTRTASLVSWQLRPMLIVP